MFNEIIKSFHDLTPILWASQIAGFIGLIVIAISFQFDKKKYLFISGISFIFFILEQVLANLYSNMIVSVAALIRNFWMYYYLKKYNSEIPIKKLYLFLVVIWICDLTYMGFSHTFNVWTNYLAPLLITMHTILSNFKNYYVLKGASFVHEAGYLVLYLVYRLPLSAFREIVLMTAILVSVILMIIKDIRNKKNT